MQTDDELKPLSCYAKELRQKLPAELFARSPARLWWLPIHLAVIFAAGAALLHAGLPLAGKLGLALVIGHSYGVLGFMGHEILHGSVVKGRGLQDWLGGLCFLPYCVGPVHWRTWHNKFHHCHTESGPDPDSFGNVRTYLAQPAMREIAKFAPGSGYLRSYFFLGFWFSAQALWVLFAHSRQFHYWPPVQRRRQLWLFAGMVAFWASILGAVGFSNFLYLYILPMFIANALQMTYISTNHMLCDETEETNDPLANSLSVQVPWPMSHLHLNFGFHVEHHIFPAMNPRHAPRVQSLLQQQFGPRYHNLPLWQALLTIYRTPRIHLSRRELVDMRTGDVFSTLGAHNELPHPIERVPMPVRPRRQTDAAPGNHDESPPRVVSGPLFATPLDTPAVSGPARGKESS